MASVPLTDDPRTEAFGNSDFDEKHLRFRLDRERYPEEFRSSFKRTMHVNPTGRGRYDEPYDAQTIALVRKRFGRDLEWFGYGFGG